MYKVIIVEDDPMVSMINRHYIEQDRRFSVIEVFRNGTDALDFLLKNKVDLAILDIYMPEMDGLSLLKKIRMKEINTDVIMVTASNEKSTLDTLLKFGVVDYLVKPFVQSRFQRALDKFVQYSKAAEDVTVLNQNKIDEIMNTEHNDESENDMPKGIQHKTLDKIKEYMQISNKKGYTAEEIAEHLNISKVTIRKYMTYLLKNGQISEKLDYETGGRPKMVYFLNKKF